ncbi:MAG: hypothetical protein JWQ74_2895 [Marmoricola sp.]|nr:hypothetical protein [Marmoricola sp.]
MNRRRGYALLLSCTLALAALHGISPVQANAGPQAETRAAKINRILKTDDTARRDSSGHVYYVEQAPTRPRPDQPSAPTRPGKAAVSVPVPSLHSRSGSTHKIYLDFNGVTLPSTSAWAQEPDAMPAGTYTGFSLDGDASQFNDQEVAYIQRVWTYVSEKFSTFDIDVTTDDPGVAGITRTNAADNNYGTHVVIADDAAGFAACGDADHDDVPDCGGIAFLDVFDGYDVDNQFENSGVYDPAWVFPGTIDSQWTSEATSHEVGHTLGLEHDGTSTEGYYSGQANWSPLMGSGYNAVQQWSKGEYADANNTVQDDLAIIARNGNNHQAGSLRLSDDYGTTGGSPTALGAASTYTRKGVISNAADDDLFSISRTCTLPLTATATGIGAEQSVDLKVDILTNGNGVLATDNPASSQFDASAPTDAYYLWQPAGMDATATLPSTTAGTTYRVRVDGTGNANPLTDGYSDYGSIGQYTLTISGCPTVLAVPGAPDTISATPAFRATTGTISWTAPIADGGSAVTGYSITGLPGGTKSVGNVVSYAATDLVPGTTYSVGVSAVNALGAGAPATTTLTVGTWAPTSPPELTASVSGTAATLSWTAPANPGGASLAGWQILRTSRGTTTSTIVAAAPLAATLTDLTAGTHSFTVTGIYGAADISGAAPSDTRSVTITTVPGLPTTLRAVQTDRAATATITWTAPGSDGGVPISGYSLTGLPGGAVNLPASARTYRASGLTLGTRYTFAVRASNALGAGATRSVAITVQPWTPSAPKIGTATSGASGGTKSATATWSAPSSTGGSAVTGYQVYAYKLTSSNKVAKTYTSVSLRPTARSYSYKLPAGRYKFRVLATNARGTSPLSGYSKVVTAR